MAEREISIQERLIPKSQAKRLAYLKAYQTWYEQWVYHKDSDAARLQAENDLRELVGYVTFFITENDKLLSELKKIREVEINRAAENQADKLNYLQDTPDVIEKLNELRKILCLSSNYIKGVVNPSVKSSDEWLEDLETTTNILERNFRDLIYIHDPERVARGFQTFQTEALKNMQCKRRITNLAEEFEVLLNEIKYYHACRLLNDEKDN